MCFWYFIDSDGKYVVKFGVLFADDRCANIFEALVGTLKAAKKRKILTYQGELLLQGVHDDVDITLIKDSDNEWMTISQYIVLILAIKRESRDSKNRLNET